VVTADAALVELLRLLHSTDYRFITVTPATHERVLAREPNRRPDLRDILGWNRTFETSEINPELLALLRRADAVEDAGESLRSRIRVSSLDGVLFVHSAYPTDDRDAVFFGPDTYRFIRFIRDRIRDATEPTTIVDMGTGCGVGGVIVAKMLPDASVKLVDASEKALRFARINAEAAGVAAEFFHDDKIPAQADLIIANPPYLRDESGRTYRDGGDLLGGRIALEWAEQALSRLNPGGRLLLYTGAAFRDGEAPLLDALESAASNAAAALEIEEIDPDVFGEELDRENYSEVERIAAIGAILLV
jgi:methylase of polypeptide subunit release factors